jgi:carbon storage regulator CsrA
MLVLTRKQSETIQIGDSITITVLRMKGKSVRIGIKAPHDMNVIRGELAFELPEEQLQDSEAEEPALADSNFKPKQRTIGSRGNNSWSTKSEPPAAVKTACSASWNI